MASSQSSSAQQQQQAPNQIDTSSLPQLTSPPGPTSPQLEKDAARAMSSTHSWKPVYSRKQSYHKEDQKHELQMKMSGLGDDKAAPGFSQGK
jgi:hypothetical protein